MTIRYAALLESLFLAAMVTAAQATLGAATLSAGADDRWTTLAVTTSSENPALVAPLATGQRARMPVLVSMPPLVYPTLAKMANAVGTVDVEILVGNDGRVIEAHAVSGHFVLRSYAEKTIRHWRYTPAMMNNHPIEATTYARLIFHQ